MLKEYQNTCKLSLDAACSLEQVGESSALISIKKDSNCQLSLLVKNQIIQTWYAKLKSRSLHQTNNDYVLDLIAAYDSLLIEFDSFKYSFFDIVSFLKALPETESRKVAGVKHTVKVCFDLNTQDLPNDINNVCRYLNLNRDSFIDAIQGNAYRVFATGFIPYFSYLGELEEALSMPRLKQPRLQVPAGAVAIADRQVAIYPSKSPGGWHIVAYSNYQFNDRQHFLPGDEVTFVATPRDEFMQERAEYLQQDSV